MKEKVFVYGTLRKGLSWNHLLSTSKFLGEAKTKNKYALYAETIPYVIEDKEVSQIAGEVYEVDNETLQKLDQLEGHPNWYRRKEIEIMLNNSLILAWIYFYPKIQGRLILSGDYKEAD